MLHAPGLTGFLIFLVVAGVVVPLFHRARIGTVLGFLIAGVVLGPHGLGGLVSQYPFLEYVTFSDPKRAEVLAEFGIIILLFLLGLELSLKRLWELRRYVLGVGLAQVIVTATVIGLAIRLAGAPPPTGLVLGMCLALSSTAIAMQVLIEQNRAATQTGRVALSVLLFQDLMVVPILFVVGMVAAEGGQQNGVVQVVLQFAQALVALFLLMIGGRYLLRPLLRSALRTGSRDLIMALALLILMVFSGSTSLAGLSPALGAFLAGLMLSESEVRHQIEVDLEPFKGLLLGIFFITVGTSLDVGGIAPDIGWILLIVVLMMAVKAAILFSAIRAFGAPLPVAAEVALLLSQAGEFAFVVIGVAAEKMPPRLAAGAIAAVGISMLLTPLAALLGRKAAGWFDQQGHRQHEPGVHLADLEDHVVIGGCGRVGHLVAQALKDENVPFVCLDTDGEGIAAMRKEGWPVFYGDATREELLGRVGGGQARAFVVTVNEARAAEQMVRAARRINRRAMIFARAKDHYHAARLVKLGAMGVIPEAVEASLQLAARVLESLDLPIEQAEMRIEQMRAAELARLDEAESRA